MRIFENWGASWLDVICGLVSIITFTMYRPWWDFEFRTWAAKRSLTRKIMSK